ncbi:hypothetical protein DD931_13365, partial [Staphylococcus pseudintermedius]
TLLLELEARAREGATRRFPAHLRVAQFEIVRVVGVTRERGSERQRTEKALGSGHAVVSLHAPFQCGAASP